MLDQIVTLMKNHNHRALLMREIIDEYFLPLLMRAKFLDHVI